jgi:hypothetical protein
MTFDQLEKELQQCLTSGIKPLTFKVNITHSPLPVFQARIQNFQSEAAQTHF